MFRLMKVTFHLDGTGVFYDPYEPLTLDGILAAAVCRWHVHGEPPRRDEEPFEIPLPLAKWHIDGQWGWRASALFPEGDTAEGLEYWRQRCRQHRIELTTGSPNLTNGPYREWNMPLPLLLSHRMVAYAVGDIHRVRRELRRSIKYLGKKRAHGRGAITAIDVDRAAEDWSLVYGEKTTRWLPTPGGRRLVRPRPPYWNIVGRVPCCEIGDHAETPQPC